jgi:hypothetical protein
MVPRSRGRRWSTSAAWSRDERRGVRFDASWRDADGALIIEARRLGADR